MAERSILIADDDPRTIRFVSLNLKARGYEVLVAQNGEEALQQIVESSPNLVILDLMMPGLNGFEVCARVREFSTVPILVLSGRNAEPDIVRAFDLGADDYLTKPFGVPELLARIQAVLRRTEAIPPLPGPAVYRSDGLQIDLVKRRVIAEGVEVKLTRTEYALLRELTLADGRVLTHHQLLTQVWGPEYANDTQYLHVYIGRLRSKLEPNPKEPRYILTDPGVGYHLAMPASPPPPDI